MKKTYQSFCDFTAQSRNVAALFDMYSRLKEHDPDDGHIELTPIVVFMAFTIESYLNNLGARQFSFWDEIERLPWRKKVNVLHSSAGKDVDWGTGPLQFATKIFRIRDRLAHGKPESVAGPLFDDFEGIKFDFAQSGDLQPDWYNAITREWVFDAGKSFEGLMAYLSGLFDLPEEDYLTKSQDRFVEHTDFEAD